LLRHLCRWPRRRRLRGAAAALPARPSLVIAGRRRALLLPPDPSYALNGLGPHSPGGVRRATGATLGGV
jgi:hypothetical protein